MRKIASAIEKVSEWTGKVFSWVILGIIVVTCYEVVARYVFESPTIWAHESATMMYGSYCLLVGAYTYRYNGHVRMDIFYRRFSRRTKATVDFFTGLLALGFLGVFFRILVEYSVKSWAVLEYSSISPWEPPIYPFKTALALAVLLLLLQQIAWLIRNFAVMLNKKGFLTEPLREGLL